MSNLLNILTFQEEKTQNTGYEPFECFLYNLNDRQLGVKMPPLNISFTRPLTTTTETLNETVAAKTIVETTDAFRLPIVIENIDPPTSTDATASYTSASNLITTTNTDAYRIGDAIDSTGGDFSGSGDFPAGTVVASIVAGVSVTVDQNATATSTSVDINPQNIDVTIAILETKVATTSTSMSLSPSVYIFDGSAAAEGSTVNNYDDLTADDASVAINFAVQTINLDELYTAVRVPRN